MEQELLEKLEKDEIVLYYGDAKINKTSIQFGRILLLTIVLILFWILFILEFNKIGYWSIRNLFGIIVLIIVLGVLSISLIYGIIYNIYLKYRNKNNLYYITNKRIAVYNSKKGFKMRNISDIQHIGISREKDNYGDISFSFYGDDLFQQIKNTISFDGIENPRKVVEIISEYNKNIHVYNDKSTILGKKI